MYNLLDYSDSYSVTSESMWNYYRIGVNDAANENDAANNTITIRQQEVDLLNIEQR